MKSVLIFLIVLNLFNMIMKSTRQTVFQLCYLLWTMVYFIGVQQNDLLNLAAFIILPSFILDQIYGEYKSVTEYYYSDGKTTLDNHTFFNDFGIVYLMGYAFLIAYERRVMVSGRITQILQKNFSTMKEKKKSLQQRLEDNLDYFLRNFLAPLLRYIALGAAISAGLSTINIPNSFLVAGSFILIRNSSLDKDYWTLFMFYQIFLILHLYVVHFFNDYINTVNLELVSIFGMSSSNPELYRNRMVSYLFAMFVTALCRFSKKPTKRLSGSDPDKKMEAGQIFSILTRTRASIQYLANFMESFSIWVFHSVVHTLLFSTELNVVSILLLFLEGIVFPVQLYQWINRGGGELYQSLYRSWRWIYRLIVANAIYRYLMFFARYTIIKRLLAKYFDRLMPTQISIFIFNREISEVDSVQKDFAMDAIVLVLSYYTTICLLAKIEQEKAKMGISKEPEDLKEKLLDSSSEPALRHSDERELAHRLQLSASVKPEEKSQSALSYRHTTTFTIGLLIFKGVTFLYMGWHATNNSNAYKVMLMLAPLIYFNTLFVKICSSMKDFLMREMLEKHLHYFFIRFASSVKYTGLNKGLRLDDCFGKISRDSAHYHLYFYQFLKRMEQDVVSLSNKFWPYIFVMWLLYTLTLIVIRILVEYGLGMHSFFKYFGLFYGSAALTMDIKLQILREEQIGNQIIFGFLIFEFLLFNYYFSLPDNIEVMDKERITKLVEVIKQKLEFYIDKKGDLGKRSEYLKAVRDFEDVPQDEMRGYMKSFAECTPGEVIVYSTGPEFAEPSKSSKNELSPTFSDDKQQPRKSSLELFDSVFLSDATVDGARRATFQVNRTDVIRNLNLTKSELEKYDEVLKQRRMTLSTLGIVDSEASQDTNAVLGNSKKLTIRITMEEDTKTHVKVLFKQRNNHMYALGRVINSLSYIVTRFMILPLLYSIGFESYINFLFLIVTMGYIFRFNLVPFEQKMKIFMPIFTFVIFLENITIFISALTQGKQDSTTFNSAFSRFWLVFLSCVGFASIILASKFVFTTLCVIDLDPTDVFYALRESERKIEIDFSKWKYGSTSWVTGMTNSLYVHLSDIYMTGVIVFCLLNLDNPWFLAIMVFLFGYSIFTRFTKSFITLESELNATKHLSILIKLVVIILFLFQFFKQIIEYLGKFGLDLGGLKENSLIKSGSGADLMIIFSLILFDLLQVGTYTHDKRKLNKLAELQMKYSDICEAQEQNEKKIYNRVMIMMAHDRLQSQIDRYLKQGLMGSVADLNYHKTDVKDKLRDNRYVFLGKYLEDFQIFMISTMESIYVSILKHTNQYHDQDLMYLLTKVCQFDGYIANSSELCLTDYLSGDLRVFDTIYKDISEFYSNLLDKEPGAFELFKSRISVFEQYYEPMKDEEYSMLNPAEMNENSQCLSSMIPTLSDGSITARRTTRGATKRGELDSGGSMRVSSVNFQSATLSMTKCLDETKKKREDLSAAAGLLAGKLTEPRQYKNTSKFATGRNSARFHLEEEECTIIFHNIRFDAVKKTKGFMQLTTGILPLLRRMLMSNIESLVCFLILVSLFLQGGFFCLIILAILFLRILIEEHGGKSIWWEVLNMLYFTQFFLKILAVSLKLKVNDPTQSIKHLLCFFAGNSESLADLRMEAVAQILIMWLMQFISKKAINTPNGKNLMSTGISFVRVEFTYQLSSSSERNSPIPS